MDEQQLLTRAKAGDGEAFGQLYDLTFDDVRRYLGYQVSDQHLVDDLTADTYLKALRSVRHLEYRGPGTVRAWLVRIARNLLADHWKNPRRCQIPAGLPADWWRTPTAPAADVQAVTGVETARVLAAVRQLPAEQRECVVLRFLLDLPISDTAAAMGRSVTAIKALQWRAVRALGRQLEPARTGPPCRRPPRRPPARTAP